MRTGFPETPGTIVCILRAAFDDDRSNRCCPGVREAHTEAQAGTPATEDHQISVKTHRTDRLP